MCLYKGSNKMQIASEDIVCYKIIEIYHLPGGDDYRSYFQRTKIELNEPILPEWEVTAQDLDGTNHLYGEVVHAYTSKAKATTVAIFLKEFCSMSVAVVECVIPAGVPYWVSEYHHEIAAKEMKITAIHL